MVTVHARSVRRDTEPKSVAPAGFQVAGSVFADAAGVLMLSAGILDGDLWIVEGTPDFLVTATGWGDAADPAPAVLGIISGSWTTEFADRVPDGSHVVIAVHPDSKGEEFAALIAGSLGGRVRLSRRKPKDWAAS
jgi:hypothetical protein